MASDKKKPNSKIKPGSLEDLHKATLEHDIEITKYEQSQNLKAQKKLKELKEDLTSDVAREFPASEKNIRKKRTATSALAKKATARIDRSFKDLNIETSEDLARFAEVESQFQKNAINQFAGGKIADKTLDREAGKRLLAELSIRGAPSSEWWQRQSASLQNKFKDVIINAYNNNWTPEQTIEAIRGTAERGFSDGIMKVAEVQAEALARTSVQTVANASRLATIHENRDVIQDIQWVATLDGRTTTLCRGLNGKRWEIPSYKPVNHGTPFPGAIAHWRCRSTQIPVTKPWSELPKSKQNLVAEEARANMGEAVISPTSFAGYLKGLSTKELAVLTGDPKIARSFKRGKLSDSDMLRAISKQPIDLDLIKQNLKEFGLADFDDLKLTALKGHNITDIEELIVGSPNEIAIILSGRSKPLKIITGNTSTVEFNWFDRQQLFNNIITHNHGAAASFSTADMQLFFEHLPKQFRVTMPVTDLQAGFLGATAPARQATIVLEKIGDGPSLGYKEIMKRLKEERELYFKSLREVTEDVAIGETRARFATYTALNRVSKDVPGFKVYVEFANGKVGVPESLDDLANLLRAERSVSVKEPESQVLSRARKLGLDVDNDVAAEARVRGILKELSPDTDSADWDLDDSKVWQKVSNFVKKNEGVTSLPLNQFEAGETFETFVSKHAWDIRDAGGPSNRAWIKESTKYLFDQARVDSSNTLRPLTIAERVKLQKVLDSKPIHEAFGFEEIKKRTDLAVARARADNARVKEKAKERIASRQESLLVSKDIEFREDVRQAANKKRAAQERLARAKASGDVEKQLIAEADIAEVDSFKASIGSKISAPAKTSKFKPVPRFKNEKQVPAKELPDLDESVRKAQGKATPVREAAARAEQKVAVRYDEAYEDFIHMDISEFEDLLNKSMRGAKLTEHESLVINRGIAAASSKYSLIPDNFKPKSFSDLMNPEMKRKLLVNYQAHLNIDKKLRKLREGNLLKKASVDPVTGESSISIAEESVLARSLEKLTSQPVLKNKEILGYKIDDKFIPKNNMDDLLDFVDEGKYIIGANRVEPFIQSLVQFAEEDFDWSKVKNFKAMMNGTKTTPGVLYNKTIQYTDKLIKEWEATKQTSLNRRIALAKRSEAGVNAVSKQVLAKEDEARLATTISNRYEKLIRYPNLTDEELIAHTLFNQGRLDPANAKAWHKRIKRPQQDYLISKTPDGSDVVIEPADLRKKMFKQLSQDILNQRNSTTIAEVNRSIGEMVLDARLYKQLKTKLLGKIDMSDFENEWAEKVANKTTDMNLFEYGLRRKLATVMSAQDKTIDSIHKSANKKINDAYAVSLKSPKKAEHLNLLDDQKLAADAKILSSKAEADRLAILSKGRRAGIVEELKASRDAFVGTDYGKRLSKDLLVESSRPGAEFDQASKNLGVWLQGSKWTPEEYADRSLAIIMDADLSQGAMGPVASRLGSLLARSAGIRTDMPEMHMQVGAKVLDKAERQGFIRKFKAPLLNKDGNPIFNADGKIKEGWFVEVLDEKLREAALADPKLRRFSKLPQTEPPKFNPLAPWEYDDGTPIAKLRDERILEDYYGKPSIYREAIEAKNNTAYFVSKPTHDFFDKIRARGLKNSEGKPVIPSWDLSVSPKSNAGIVNRSKTVQWNNIHKAAGALKADEQLYFKYTSDFRGRSYASGVVHPQGPPQAKAYFRFKNVSPIKSQENANHFWIELANRTGDDKLPKSKADYEDWKLVKDKYGADAAKKKLTAYEYGYEYNMPKFAKIWDDVQSEKFWKDSKARLWIDEWEEEWPEVFAAAEEVDKLRSHVEKKLGKKLFKVNKDGSYSVALPKSIVDKAIADYSPHLVPHIDGTTNAYQQMGMITRDRGLGRIANLEANKKLYDAYYYTGITIKESEESVVAAQIRAKRPALYEKAKKALYKDLKAADPDDELDIIGKYLKRKNYSEFDRAEKEVAKALEVKRKAIEAMPEVFGKDATVTMSDLRPLFKKPVMLQPYGASITTILNEIKKEGWKLAKKNPEKFGFLSEGDNAKLLGHAIMEMNPIFYPKAREYQNFLVDLARRYNAGRYNAVTGKYATKPDGRPDPIPFEFTSPSGVRVKFNYRIKEDIPVEVTLGDDTAWLTTTVSTDRIHSAKQVSGISAHMTHAHDAAWDHMWTKILKEKGVKNFLGIHDAAGTDFGHMDQLHQAWREAGVKMYQNYDLFDELIKQAKATGVNVEGLTPPKKGILDVRELLESLYAIH